MTNDDIATLFILDENDEELGRLVLDVGKLFSMYNRKPQPQLRAVLPEVPLPDPADTLDEIVNEKYAFYRKPDGSLYLARRHS